MRNKFTVFAVVSLLFVAAMAHFVSPSFWWWMVVLVPILLLGFYDMFQAKHAIMRNFPVFGRGRYLMEDLLPKLSQYYFSSAHVCSLWRQ